MKHFSGPFDHEELMFLRHLRVFTPLELIIVNWECSAKHKTHMLSEELCVPYSQWINYANPKHQRAWKPPPQKRNHTHTPTEI
jgi:hypothetical protein